MAYSIELYNAISKEWKKGDVKKMHLAKIKELRKNGFYMDSAVVERNFEANFEWFCKKRLNDSGVEIGKAMEVVFKYDLKDGARFHEFIKVNPKGWKFTYVDNKNADKVLHIDANFPTAEPFFGIYVRNDKLKAHDFMQYDFTSGIWYMTANTLFGGRTRLLCNTDGLTDGGWCGTLGCHQGGVFSSWKEYADSFDKRTKSVIAANEDRISELKATISELKRKNAEEKKVTGRKVKRIVEVTGEYERTVGKVKEKSKDFNKIFPYYVCYFKKNGKSIEAPNVYLTLDEAEDYAEELRDTYGGKIDVERVEKGRRFIETVVL